MTKNERNNKSFISVVYFGKGLTLFFLNNLYAFFNQPASLAEKADVSTNDRTVSNHVTQSYQ